MGTFSLLFPDLTVGFSLPAADIPGATGKIGLSE